MMYINQNGQTMDDPVALDLLGMYQQKNLCTTLMICDVLRPAGFPVSWEQLREGLSSVRAITGLRGRWEIIGHNPLVICDAAHNREGIKEVIDQIKQTPWKNLHIVLGMVDDKDPGHILEPLPRDARYYFTQAAVPRAMDREKLARRSLEYGLYGQVCPTPKRALEIARYAAGKEDLILVGGSTFTVAEVLD
jgi:dihydrofolate synthase/folylpolyglutamate synthase